MVDNPIFKSIPRRYWDPEYRSELRAHNDSDSPKKPSGRLIRFAVCHPPSGLNYSDIDGPQRVVSAIVMGGNNEVLYAFDEEKGHFPENLTDRDVLSWIETSDPFTKPNEVSERYFIAVLPCFDDLRRFRQAMEQAGIESTRSGT